MQLCFNHLKHFFELLISFTKFKNIFIWMAQMMCLLLYSVYQQIVLYICCYSFISNFIYIHVVKKFIHSFAIIRKKKKFVQVLF